MGEVTKLIEKKLTAALKPSFLEITDDSESHRGHAGHDGSGESHFTVTIQSDAFIGQGRVAMQRLVMGALKEELAGKIHALAIKASVPS
ncbi:MAG: BolA family transcriptional regulator [Kordiimonadaceae bacterium]|nr:BolA family transcriptional regulator [Kordiimonadaceae bacterium]